DGQGGTALGHVTITVVRSRALVVSQDAPGTVFVVDADAGTVTASTITTDSFFDPAVVTGGATGLVTTFNNGSVDFVDLTALSPTVTGSVNVGMSAFDID